MNNAYSGSRFMRRRPKVCHEDRRPKPPPEPPPSWPDGWPADFQATLYGADSCLYIYPYWAWIISRSSTPRVYGGDSTSSDGTASVSLAVNDDFTDATIHLEFSGGPWGDLAIDVGPDQITGPDPAEILWAGQATPCLWLSLQLTS